jgi:hypothetical protein
MSEEERDLHTDTHLSRDFNKVLQSLMIVANNWRQAVKSTPHYDYLMAYHGAIDNLFINTFFLFGHIKYENDNLTMSLMAKMDDIEKKLYNMKYYPATRTREYFDIVVEKCRLVHMMIMFGLNKRNMLVRTSENDPRGAEAIEHWAKKSGFRKGDLKIESVTKDNKRYLSV